MAFTYSKLAEVTVGAGGTSAITFNNIPQNYNDLIVKLSIRWSNAGPDGIYVSFNGSTASFTSRIIEASGSAASSSTPARLVGGLEGTGYTASTFGNAELYIPNYTSSNNKSFSADSVTENNATAAYSQLIAGLWSNVTAITSLSLTPSSGTFIQYSTAYLYGVKAEV